MWVCLGVGVACVAWELPGGFLGTVIGMRKPLQEKAVKDAAFALEEKRVAKKKRLRTRGALQTGTAVAAGTCVPIHPWVDGWGMGEWR